MQEVKKTLSTIPQMKIVNEFKIFIMRGNVVDLAIAVIIGGAFGAVIKSLVDDIFTPFIAAIVGTPDFSYVNITIGKGVMRIGLFINALIAFLIVAAVLFFLVVKPINMLQARAKKEPPPDPTTRNCPFCLNTIPIGATKCGFCTSEVPSVVA